MKGIRRFGLFFVMLLVISLMVVPYSGALAATDAEIEQSIEEGIGWLVSEQNPDGSWDGFFCEVAHTGFAVVKLEDRAIELGYGSPFDPAYPYSANVVAGLDYLFANAYTIDIWAQPAGDPDTNGNGIGVRFQRCANTYETGIAMMAIAASRDLARVVNVPGSDVDGWTYQDVLQDAVDYFAFGQVDAGSLQRGGWGYSHNESWADNSNSGYAVLGLRYAEAFGCTIPNFVKSELSIWIDWVQNDVDGDADDGGSGYSDPGWVNILKTGNLLFEMEFVGDTVATQRVIDAIDYIERHWNDPNSEPGWRPHHYQAMYCAMKGFESLDIDTIEVGGSPIDWYDEFADAIVGSQNPDGSWPVDMWGGQLLATEWALLTLEKVVPPIEVEIDIKPCIYPNYIRTCGRFIAPYVQVAILTTPEFNACLVDPTTVRFGPAGAQPVSWYCFDLRCARDFDRDLILTFRVSDVGLQPGDTEATLTGETYDGTPIIGIDSVRVPPCTQPFGWW